jgi:hypothetical protein
MLTKYWPPPVRFLQVYNGKHLAVAAEKQILDVLVTGWENNICEYGFELLVIHWC